MKKVTLKLTRKQFLSIIIGLNSQIEEGTGNDTEELINLREYIRGAYEAANFVTYKSDFKKGDEL